MADALLLASGGYLLSSGGGKLLLQGSSDTGSGGDEMDGTLTGAIIGVPDERIATPIAVQGASSTGLATGYAVLVKQALGVGARFDFVYNFATLLGGTSGDQIARIRTLTENANAGSAGVSIDGADDDYPPIIDVNGRQRVRIFLGCTPPSGSTAFNGAGIIAGFTCAIETAGTNGQPVRVFVITMAVPVRAS